MRRSSLNYFFEDDYHGYDGHVFNIDTAELLDYFDYLKNLDSVSIQTRRNKWSILKSFLQYTMEYYNAKGYKFIVVIPEKTVSWNGSVPKEDEVITNKNVIIRKSEIEKLLHFFKQSNTKHYLIFRLFVETGMRKGELLQAKYEDVDFQYRHIRITKGKTGLKYYVFSKSFSQLLNFQVKSRKANNNTYPHLFLTKFGEPYGNRSFNLLLKKACKKLGIENNITTHTFRRSINTYRKKEMNCPLIVCKRLLGHKISDVNEASYTIFDFKDLVEMYDKYNPYKNLNL